MLVLIVRATQVLKIFPDSVIDTLVTPKRKSRNVLVQIYYSRFSHNTNYTTAPRPNMFYIHYVTNNTRFSLQFPNYYVLSGVLKLS